MPKSSKPTEAVLVSCEICMKEVPIDEAKVPEGADYFMHFCGLECYEKWKSQGAKPKEKDARKPGL